MATILAMSKITFRADDDLVDQLESLELSKSEAMREALRSYLERGDPGRSEPSAERRSTPSESGAVDELIRQRVDELLEERLREYGTGAGRNAPASEAAGPNDINITISLDDGRGRDDRDDAVNWTLDGTPEPTPRETGAETAREPLEETTCDQCGESVAGEHVYCPNCGEKTSRRLFCECGDEIRSDWSFCPGCGRRTPAADVLGGDGPS